MEIVSIAFITIGVLSGIAQFVLWIISLYQAIVRKDLKEAQWLWIILILLFGSLGSIIYFFVEDRKKYGVWSIVTLVVSVLSIMFAIIPFFITTQSY